LLAVSRDGSLLDAVQRPLHGDDEVRAGNELDLHWLHVFASLQHALPGFQRYVLEFHGRHFSVEAQPAEGHAPLPALGAAERRQIVPMPVGPAPSVVEQVDEPLFHFGECFFLFFKSYPLNSESEGLIRIGFSL
jgi:hypothetical protein